ncbi:MAG: ATP--guanido phosphotransferase [Clostridia bacterium]|nr:ATP--guanido phosphotransferase [Clostridia bacterium]
MEHWIYANGADRDVVVSTRISFARNIAGLPFPASMTDDQRALLIETVAPSIEAENLARCRWDDLSLWERQAMVERRLVNPIFGAGQTKRAVYASDDECLVVAVGGQDHLKLQALASGLALEEAYARLDALDTALDAALHFAFDSRLGYLTQSPSDLGTAMHASVYLHLPALQQSRFIYELGNTVSKLGLSLTSVYGEAGKSGCSLYQLSNRVTLGITEQAAISNLASFARQIVRQERLAREELRTQPTLEDRVWRSYGLMKNARLLPLDECRTLWSNVRVGAAIEMLPDLSLATVDALLLAVGGATVMSIVGKKLDQTELDKERATIVRERV